MSPKTETWEKIYLDYGYTYKRVKLTGRCKTVSGGTNRYPQHYYEVKGFLRNRWLHEDYIKFTGPTVVTIRESCPYID